MTQPHQGDWLEDISDIATVDALMAEKEWEKLQRHHGVAGFREGVAEALDSSSMQKAFNKGFEAASRLSLQIGGWAGTLEAQSLSENPTDAEQNTRGPAGRALDRRQLFLAKLKSLDFDQLFTRAWLLDHLDPEAQFTPPPLFLELEQEYREIQLNI
ncbi:hypothetical protein HDU91_000444 [Kappamyces sp. JEL0680]|nr:hypothetical protein HDU91_000444 [Kappamyces sp. JEL0680]